MYFLETVKKWGLEELSRIPPGTTTKFSDFSFAIPWHMIKELLQQLWHFMIINCLQDIAIHIVIL